MTIYLIRHGETVANRERIWGMDYPLTEKGFLQAMAVEPPDVSLVLKSNLIRAKQTAKAIYPEMAHTEDSVFREIGFGVMENQKMVEGTRELMTYYHNPQRLHLEIEGAENIFERAVDALRALLKYSEQETKGDIALVSHKSLMRAMISIIEDQTLDHFLDNDIPNCGVVPVDTQDILKALILIDNNQ